MHRHVGRARPGGVPDGHGARHRSRKVRFEPERVQDLTLQVAAARKQMAVTVGQDTDSQATYTTDAPRQTTDAVPGAPHVSARPLPPYSRPSSGSPSTLASLLAP